MVTEEKLSFVVEQCFLYLEEIESLEARDLDIGENAKEAMQFSSAVIDIVREVQALRDAWLSAEAALTDAGLPINNGETLSDAIERIKDELEQCSAEVHRLRAELADMRKDLNDARSNWESAVEYGRERDAELSECKRALAVRSIDERYASRMAVLLECALMRHGGSCWDDGMALLEEYRAEWRAVSDDPPTFMGEPVIDAAMQADSGKGGVE